MTQSAKRDLAERDNFRSTDAEMELERKNFASAFELDQKGIDVESLLKRRSHNLAIACLLPRTSVDPRLAVDFLAAQLGSDAAEILVDYVFELVMEGGKPDRWISEVGRARDRGALSPEVAHFLIYHLAEWSIQHLTSTHPVLCGLTAQINRIEREHGLAKDDYWRVNEGPPEWQALCDEYATVSEELLMDILLRNGEREVAEAHAAGDDAQLNLGRAQIFGF